MIVIGILGERLDRCDYLTGEYNDSSTNLYDIDILTVEPCDI